MKELCKHFGTCGGCDSQNIAYEEQLKMKEDRIRQLFSAFSVNSMEKIVPSAEIFNYRNKMEYAVSSDKGDISIGLRQKRKFYRIVDLHECRIFFGGVQNIFNIFKDWIKANNIEPYQLRSHSGNIRYVAMRHAKHYNELMIIAVLTSNVESIGSLVDNLKRVDPVKAVYLCINDGLADVSVTGNLKLMHGQRHIRERINDVDYLISPNSFFQTNPYCCGRLYAILRSETKKIGGEALDMCCGAGGITLQITDNFDKVTGVDNQPQNIEDALLNAQINKKNNVKFICDDAEKFLLDSTVSKEIRNLSTIVFDPPRAGLSKKAKEAVCSSGVENVIYVSCNPVNLAEDLKALASVYKIEKMIPVDMFPHTRHVEVIAILKRDKV